MSKATQPNRFEIRKRRYDKSYMLWHAQPIDNPKLGIQEWVWNHKTNEWMLEVVEHPVYSTPPIKWILVGVFDSFKAAERVKDREIKHVA